MIITADHIQFYRERKVPRPSWAPAIKTSKVLGRVYAQETLVSVHTLINAQVPEVRKHRTEPNNLIHLIRLVQSHKAETVTQFLYRLATKPCGTDPKRRVGYARAWYQKLTRKGKK
jgi:hypothetical protein